MLDKAELKCCRDMSLKDRIARMSDESSNNSVGFPPGHFYSPIPDTGSLSDSIWEQPSELVGIDLNDAMQLELLTRCFPRFADEYNSLPMGPTGCEWDFHFNNSKFDGTDALVLYAMVRYFRPRLIAEIGAGYSTRLAALAALRNHNTELITIEPYPDNVIRAGFPGLARLISKKVQEVGSAFFQQLRAGDILFIDSSHVVKIDSDVLYLYLEVLPRLAPGVIVHMHDIFLPYEYPKEWVKELGLFWTEQYLLRAFLIYNSQFEVLLANTYLAHRYPNELRTTFPRSTWWGGGSFWIRRRTEGAP